MERPTNDARRNVLLLNVGHALDHFFMLVFTTAVLAMEREFADSYGRLLLLTTWSFLFFGGASIPAGWMGDRWSRHGMMVVFFVGIGAASILTGMATGPLGIEIGLALIGTFAAIYHPVGIALVVEEASRVGRALAINGVWGNIGVALAAVTTGAIVDLWSWRAAFVLPGAVSMLIGLGYAWLQLRRAAPEAAQASARPPIAVDVAGRVQQRVFVLLIVAPLFGGVIFNATTITLPKILDERLTGLLDTTSEIGVVAAGVFGLAAAGQIIVGELLDRYAIKRIYLSVISVQLVLCALAVTTYGWPALLVTAPLMLATFGAIPMNDWIVAHFISGEWRSRVYAVKSVLALGVGAIAVQISARLHARTGSFDTLFMVLAACAAIVALGALLLLPARAPVAASAK